MHISIFVSVDKDVYFFEIDEFRKYLIRELQIEKENIETIIHDFSEQSFSQLKNQIKNKSCLFFVIDKTCDNLFYFNLGLGTGCYHLTDCPIVFYSVDNSYHEYCDNFGFFIYYNEFNSKLFHKIIKNYIFQEIENFWIEISDYYIQELNKQIGIQLEKIDVETVKYKLKELEHPSLLSKFKLQVRIVTEFTFNYAGYKAEIINFLHPQNIQIIGKSKIANTIQLAEEMRIGFKDIHDRFDQQYDMLTAQFEVLKNDLNELSGKKVDEAKLDKYFEEIKSLLQSLEQAPEFRDIKSIREMLGAMSTKSKTSIKVVGTLLPTVIQEVLPLIPNIQYEMEVDKDLGTSKFFKELIQSFKKVMFLPKDATPSQ